MKIHPLCLFLIAVVIAGCKKSADTPKASEAASAGSVSGVSSPASGNPDDPVLLKMQWPVGIRLMQHMDLAQSMNIPMGPGAGPKGMSQEVSFGQDYSLTCLREREGGGHEVELEFLAASMSVQMNGNEVLAFDTRGEATGDESNPAVKPFRLMIGKKVKYQLDASNGVERVEGVKEFVEQVLGDPSAANNPMTAMFNEDYFKQMLSHDSDLPSGPVKPGATWPSHKEVTMGPLGKAVLDLKFNFERWEIHDKIRTAQITFEGSITPKAGDTNNIMGGFITLQGGTASGRNWFDPARGTATETSMKLVMNMRMKSPVQTNPPGEAATSPTTLNQNITIKLVEATRK